MSAARKQYGRAGHLIVADRCLFHLHTHIGKWCISTVGDYFPRPDGERDTVGVGRFFETMVFNLKARGRRWENVDFDGYNSAAAANNGHEAMCRKYEAKDTSR